MLLSLSTFWHFQISSNPLTPDVSPGVLQTIIKMKTDSIQIVDMEVRIKAW